MAGDESELDAYRDIVAIILRSISQDSQASWTLDEIARTVQREGAPDYSLDALQVVVGSTIAQLAAFGVVVEVAGRYRVRGPTSGYPIAHYFLASWGWYLRTRHALIDGWSRPGVPRSSHALDSAVYLLSLMERKRMRLAGIDVEPSRRQSVSFDLIKTRSDGKSYFLFEWDRTADQYQLIGGHCTDDAGPEVTAIEELIEELDVPNEHRFEAGQDFELDPHSNPAPFVWRSVSETVGALTEYRVHVYRVQLHVRRLRLAEHHRWLTVDEMLKGRTVSGRRTGDPSLFREIDARLKGGLNGVVESVRQSSVVDFWDHVDRGIARSVFIGHGHSAEWRRLADHLRDHHGYRIIAYESAPRAGRSIADILREMSSQASFALLVHTAEDEQPDGRVRARQNVVHETGLFQGRLGFLNTIVIREQGCDDFSNLAGVQELTYQGDIRQVFGDVVAALRRAWTEDAGR
jgi:Predicted nucleotide-binding protein containing TIR-like domain